MKRWANISVHRVLLNCNDKENNREFKSVYKRWRKDIQKLTRPPENAAAYVKANFETNYGVLKTLAQAQAYREQFEPSYSDDTLETIEWVKETSTSVSVSAPRKNRTRNKGMNCCICAGAHHEKDCDWIDTVQDLVAKAKKLEETNHHRAFAAVVRRDSDRDMETTKGRMSEIVQRIGY